MSTSARLSSADHQAIARMSHECRDLGDDPIGWRTHLAANLSRMAGCGLVSVVEGGLGANGSSTGRGYEWGWQGGFNRSAGELVVAKLTRNPFHNPVVGPLLSARAKQDGIALSRNDLVPEAYWYRSEYYADLREVGVDSSLYCYRQIGKEALGEGGFLSGLILLRPTGEPDFSPRQKAIVREAHTTIAPLVGGPLARFGEPSPADLPPRVRQVLRCLLEGDSDKQVASRLGLSTFTVNEYTKRVYRHFGVAGRTELLARWIRRGWGSRLAWGETEHT